MKCWHSIFRTLEVHEQGELRECCRCGHRFWHSYTRDRPGGQA